MASLRRKILDGLCAFGAPPPNSPLFGEKLQTHLSEIVHEMQILEDRTVVLIRVDAVMNDLAGRDWSEIGEWKNIPRPKPPFSTTWMEGHARDEQFGALTHRIDLTDIDREALPQYLRQRIGDDDARTVVINRCWAAKDGVLKAVYMGFFVYWLDADGNYLNQSGEEWPPDPDRKVDVFLCLGAVTILHAFARMNCHNVKLLPAKGGQPRIKPGEKHPPFSVWHEIIVTDSPALRRARLNDPVDTEKHAVRLHRVRGHYADYRKGAGLFGKYKVLIYIVEHEAGDPELGAVASTYRVE